jgi:plastocyanin
MMLRSVPVFVALGGLLTIAAACGQGSADHAPISPSAVSTANDSGGQAVQGRQDVQVTMQDACDPATFNAAIGPGTCLRSGGVSFDEFVAQLTKHGAIGAWHFAPPNANVRVGQTFLATNNGGEVHTFTQVADFGGGIVPFLNQLTGEATVAPECNALEPDDFVAPGGTYKEDVEHTGTLKFQCCIHPWMRLEARASTH